MHNDIQQVIQKSLDIIEQRLKTSLTVEELAAEAGFSLFHYYRVFQQQVGLPVMQYVQKRRLLYAAYELCFDVPLQQLAFCFGFDTYAGFYKAFCRQFGCSPSEYKKTYPKEKPCRVRLCEGVKHMNPKRIPEVLAHWQLKSEAFVPVIYASGTRSETTFLVGDHLVLKEHADRAVAVRVLQVADALRDENMAPDYLPDIAGNRIVEAEGTFVTLCRQMQGESKKAAAFYENPMLGVALGQGIGRLQQALRTCDAEGFPTPDWAESLREWEFPRLKGLVDLPLEFTSWLLHGVEELFPQVPVQLIHRDPHPGNLLWENDRVCGYLDFDLSEQNLRIFDACYAATAILSESFDRPDRENWFLIYRNIIEGYDAVMGLSGTEKKAIPFLLLANQCIFTVWFSKQSQMQKLAEINRGMLRWLVENRALLELN